MKNFILIATQLLVITTAYGAEQAENKHREAIKISLSGIGVPGYEKIILTHSPGTIASKIDKLDILPELAVVLIAQYASSKPGTMFPSTLYRDKNRFTVLTIENNLPCARVCNVHSSDRNKPQQNEHPDLDLQCIKDDLARLQPETAGEKFIELRQKSFIDQVPILSDLSMTTLHAMETLSGPSAILVGYPSDSPEISSAEQTSDIYLYGVTRRETVRAMSNLARIFKLHLEQHRATSFKRLAGDTLEAQYMDYIVEGFSSNEKRIETLLSSPHLVPLVKSRHSPDPYALAD